MPAAVPAARPDDEKQIRVAIDAFAQAFLKADAKAIAELFTEDGEAVGAEGGTIQGREALEEHYAARFADGSGDKIETTLDSIKFLDSGVGARRRPEQTGGYVAASSARPSSAFRPGYQRSNVSRRSSFRTRVRTWSRRWRSPLGPCICCFLTIRRLITWFTVDSANMSVIASP